jgi:mono/diheme cytochrome c family protein
LLYAKGNCAMCHGKSQEGTKLGPALAGLSQHGWDSIKLQAYLRDPKDHAMNPERLAELKKEYTMAMPAFTGTDEERAQLAEWLLSK